MVVAENAIWRYLLQTAEEGFSVKRFKRLLKRFSSYVNEREPSKGRTPLILSIFLDNFEAFELLLRHPNVDASLVDFEDFSPLVHSIFGEANLYFEMLIDSPKVDVNQMHENGLTPLEHAMFIRRLDFCQVLLEKGADCSSVNEDGSNHLHFYASLPLPKLIRTNFFYEDMTKSEIIELQLDCAKLVLKTVNAFETDSNGRSPLHLCCKYNQPALLDLFLQSMSPEQRREAIAAETSNSMTPLMYCCQMESIYKTDFQWLDARVAYLDCAKILISNGVDIDYLTANSRITNLMYIAQFTTLSRRQVDFTKLLLDSGANTEMEDNQEMTGYHYAIEFNCPQLLELMLERDCVRRKVFRSLTKPFEKSMSENKLSKYLEHATRCLATKLIQGTIESVKQSDIECLKLLVRFGANPTFSIGVVLEYLRSGVSAIILRELQDLGLDVRKVDNVDLITKCVVEGNFTLTSYLLQQGASCLHFFSQNLCRWKPTEDKHYHRTKHYETAEELIAMVSATDALYVVCTVCGETVDNQSKLKSCSDVQCETTVCEKCMFFKEIDEDIPGLNAVEAAQRRGDPQTINLLFSARSSIGRKLLGTKDMGSYLEICTAAGLSQPELLLNMEHSDFFKLGINDPRIHRALMEAVK